MSASFEGASNFSISGGNFNRASGSVLTYNINPNSNRSKRRGSLPNLISADAATSSEGHARRRDRREESLQRPPPSPIASATSTPSHTFTVTASSNRPLSTRPTSTARHPPTPIRYTLSTSHQSSFANHTSSDPAPSALPPSSVAHTSEHGDDGINDPSNPLIIPPHPLPPPPFNTSHNAPLPPLGSLMNGENDITAPQLSQNWRPPSTSSWAPLIQPSTLGPSSRGNSTTFHYASSLSPGPQLGNGRLVNMISETQEPSEQSPIQTPPLIDDEELLLKLADVLKMPESRKALRELKDDKAQGMIDWLHVILLRPALPGIWLRKKSTRVMYQLCKASDLYPHCHILTNVTIGPYRGCGGFSDIYEGNQGGRILCLKMLRLHPGTDIGTVQTACAREVTTWAQMRHPNIWPFHGLYFYLNGNSRRLCLVSPWARNGDLPAYLRANPNAPRETLIHDVALGLQYLEQKGLVHGDLKGLNILVSDSGTACITDFGVSSFRNDGTVSMTIGASTQGGGGSSRWAAPESVMGHPPSFKSDIWAFGCVCFEVLTGLLPFYECPNDLPIVIKLFSGELPSGSNTLQDLHPDMRELLNQCWNKEPAARPSCREILRMLKPMGATGVDRHDMGGDNRCLQAVGDVTIDRTKIREILDSVGSAEPC